MTCLRKSWFFCEDSYQLHFRCLIISVFFLSWLLVHSCFGQCHTFVLFVVVVYLLVFVCLLLLNICLPKLINSTGYWLPELKQLVCAQSTHVPKLNYQQRAYYPNQPIIPIFKVGFHKISLEISARISRVRCIVNFWNLHSNISQVCSWNYLKEGYPSKSRTGMYGLRWYHRVCFVLQFHVNFYCMSANLENFYVDKHKVEKWNNKQ